MADLTRLCIGDNCSDVQNIEAGDGIRISGNTASVKAGDFMRTVGLASGAVVVPAHDRTNVRIQFASVLPDGYAIDAFRQMSIAKTDSDPNGFKNVVIQFFGTADNGKTANLGIYNVGDVSATVNVSVTVLAVKL